MAWGSPARLVHSPWFGELILAGVCGVVLLMSVILTPTPDFVMLFGWPVPESCGVRRWFGMNCPGCGLTRSFVYMGHLQPLQAFRMHPLGPFMFLATALMPLWRFARVWRRQQGR